MDGSPVVYEAWAPNQPDFANDDENCVLMYKDTGKHNKSKSFTLPWNLYRWGWDKKIKI